MLDAAPRGSHRLPDSLVVVSRMHCMRMPAVSGRIAGQQGLLLLLGVRALQQAFAFVQLLDGMQTHFVRVDSFG